MTEKELRELLKSWEYEEEDATAYARRLQADGIRHLGQIATAEKLDLAAVLAGEEENIRRRHKLHASNMIAKAAEAAAAGVHGAICVDDTERYMQELLLPLEQLPLFSELPAFIALPLTRKLVCLDHDYSTAVANSVRARGLLLPLAQEPRAQALARAVSCVLNSQLRNVQGEDTLHYDVDTVFVGMFRLAANAGLLVFDVERNTGDNHSGTTGAGLRPDLLLWIRKTLLFKGEEKQSADELDDARSEVMAKMTNTWDEKVYGKCLYMFAYALGGNMLEIYAVKGGQQLRLLEANMSTLVGKLNVLVAVVHIMRILCAMSASLPTITWGVGQPIIIKDGRTMISRVTNLSDFVRKELRHFNKYHSKYATLPFLRSAYQAITEAAAAGGATHLVHAYANSLPVMKGEHVVVQTVPVGVAYSATSMPGTEQEAKLAVGGAVKGCGELHALGIVHRDPRWTNIIKVIGQGQTRIKVIDIEKSGVLDAVCQGEPYPLPHWEYGADSGRTVLEPDNTYSARSDLKMIGKELMAPLRCLGVAGQDLRRRLEDGEYQSATEVLAHAWFN